jgi:hypothetical protein
LLLHELRNEEIQGYRRQSDGQLCRRGNGLTGATGGSAEAGVGGVAGMEPSKAMSDRAASGERCVHWKLAGVIAASLMLASCFNMVGNSGVYYNVGLAEASNNLILANIIRSAKGYPNYYSVIGDFSESRSLSSSASLSGSVPLDDIRFSSLNGDTSMNASRDRNTSVSSLETEEFTRAMHTQVTPELFTFLLESGNGSDVNLALTLLIKTAVITRYDYYDIVEVARSECDQGFSTLSSANQGICLRFENSIAEINCPLDLEPSDNGVSELVRISNDATNRCAYTQFRVFAEALALSNARIIRDQDGSFDIRVDHDDFDSPTHKLFEAEGTGFALRSPNGITHYLGEIVRDQFSRTDGWTPRLTTRAGQGVPIFEVESGPSFGQATVSAKIDNEIYWIRRQALGVGDDDYSYRALTILKNFQALSTAQDQLPDSPTILLTR